MHIFVFVQTHTFFGNKAITLEMAEEMCRELLNRKTVDDEVDFSFDAGEIGRFRINIFKQRHGLSFVFRHIPQKIPDIDSLNMPSEVLKKLIMQKRGLILVTGTSGSGKSTTLASMVEYLNQTTHRHVITIEDPIEFCYENKKCLIQQRELGKHTASFNQALKASLRQNPDVILFGEIRSADVLLTTLEAAETGHLVLSTLHTVNAVQTIERLLSFVPSDQHDFLRLQMSLLLKGVISQRLISVDDQRLPCTEIMLSLPSVQHCLLHGETLRLRKIIDKNEISGCQTFNQSLYKMVKEKKITSEQAVAFSDKPEDLVIKLRGIVKTERGKLNRELLDKFLPRKLKKQ